MKIFFLTKMFKRWDIYGQYSLEETRKLIFSSIATFSAFLVSTNLLLELIIKEFFDPEVFLDYDLFYIFIPGLIVYIERRIHSPLITKLNILLYIASINYMAIQNIANFSILSFPITMLIWGLAMLFSGFLFRPIFVFVESLVIIISFLLLDIHFTGQTYFTSYAMFIILLLYSFFIYAMSLMMEKMIARSQGQTQHIQELFEQSKETFSEVAHRLKTPLTVLKFELEELEAGPNTDEINETFKEIQNAVNNITKLAKANIISLKQEMKPTKVDDILSPIRSSTEKLVKSLEVTSGEIKTISFEADKKILNTFVTVNEAQIRECLLNLVDNSIRHSGKNKVHIEIKVRKTKSHLLFSVIDDGIGFDRNEEKKDSSDGNLHIGLQICEKIIQNHDGVLSIKSKKGHGTKATIRIPIR